METLNFETMPKINDVTPNAEAVREYEASWTPAQRAWHADIDKVCAMMDTGHYVEVRIGQVSAVRTQGGYRVDAGYSPQN